jgi:hypothetical protein
MAAYSVDTYTLVKGTIEDAAAAMEAKIEAITDTKVIRLAKILKTKDNQYMVCMIYDH